MDTYVPSIPPALSERLIWRDGSFHASEELKGDTLLDALFARCSREMDVAVVPCRWYSPRAFEKNFGVHFMNKEGSINATVDAIVDLLRKAWTLRASDIHITYWGPYTTIELRRLGLLQPFQTLNGTEGQALILALFQSVIAAVNLCKHSLMLVYRKKLVQLHLLYISFQCSFFVIILFPAFKTLSLFLFDS